jgi:hypothetical protein
MTRVVGTQNRSEFILDPEEALRRGAVLDKFGPQILARRPRGVTRAKHTVFNAIDDQRQLELARLLNPAPKAA